MRIGSSASCGAGTPFRRALELSWESYRAGSFPVGAVLTDATGTIVAEGRNHAGETEAASGVMRNTRIAHAEMSVLAQLPAAEYAEHTIWSTLEPCLLCQAAMTMTHIGRVEYLAADAICDGLDALPTINVHAGRRYPIVVGPGSGVEARFAAILPMSLLAAQMPDGFAMGHYRTWSPADAAVADTIAQAGLWPSRELDLDGAIAAIAELLE